MAYIVLMCHEETPHSLGHAVYQVEKISCYLTCSYGGQTTFPYTKGSTRIKVERGNSTMPMEEIALR